MSTVDEYLTVAKAARGLSEEHKIRLVFAIMLEFAWKQEATLIHLEMPERPKTLHCGLAFAVHKEVTPLAEHCKERNRDAGHDYTQGIVDVNKAGAIDELTRQTGPVPDSAPEAKAPHQESLPTSEEEELINTACLGLLAVMERKGSIIMFNRAVDSGTQKDKGLVVWCRDRMIAPMLAAFNHVVEQADLDFANPLSGYAPSAWADSVVLCMMASGEGWKIQGKLVFHQPEDPTVILRQADQREPLKSLLLQAGYEASGAKAAHGTPPVEVWTRPIKGA